MRAIPERHAPEDCPACSEGLPCRIVTRKHLRYWENFRRDPDTWGPILIADARKDVSPRPAAAPVSSVPTRLPRYFDPRDPRPRACLVTPSLAVGGAERWMMALIRATSDRIAWTAVAVDRPAFVDPAMQAEADRLAPVGIGIPAVHEAVSASDVVVAWGVDMEWLATVAFDRGNPPIVGVSHGVGDWTRRLFVDCGRVAVLVGVSAASSRTLPKSERPRMRVVENCVEPDRLLPKAKRPETRAAWGIGPDELALVMVGRLSPEKNPEALADAVAELHRRGDRRWRGVHVGTGWKEAQMRVHAEAVAPGLVRFPGVTDDVAAAYHAADALALPSHEESCSLMMVEALWCGVPLIASSVGIAEPHAMADLCRIVPPGCSGAELAEAVLADLRDPAGTRDRAARGRSVARVRFAPDRFAREWADLIVSAARPRPPRQIDRSKPRMQLGEPQRPRKGCVSCAEAAAARKAGR